MLEFNYRAITAEGRTISGRQSATSESDLEARLGRMQLELLKATPVRAATLFARKKLESKELINIFIHLQTMSHAGVPLFESLIDLRDSADTPTVRRFISDLVDRIEGGASLSEALEQSPAGIDKVNVNLIRTGEATGKLPEVLAELVESLKWSDEIAAQTKKLLMYPVFAGTVVLGAVGFLMIYLVPQLLGFIRNLGGTVPIQTRALVAFSGFLVNYWYTIPLVIFLVAALWITAVRLSPAARLWVDSAKLRAPIFGPILKKIIMARFAKSFGLMYKSGVSVLDALGFCLSLSGNAAYRKAISGAALSISQGQKVSDSFAATTLFPALVVRMIRVGESTGGLDKALENVSYFYTREVNDAIEKLQGLIQPVLTLVLGGMIAWIMSSVMLPIYDLISKVKF
ncbi:MAG: type II secretion system F family protein [Pseudomonadota bacterium]|jgi:type IV pilus assembly protein PilC|uniref:type II secretion system F family protein n=1 Tax=unclassified Polaromonas TaxID=2638319 RepID=UPI000BD55F97|nr:MULTISPECIES: type II secretion system F family protein [unclassified Polaromonas]MDO8372190.1 type II secretion system F family protein [Polaromonas sp.]OYY33656.1 MAG: secretion system protein [Polaromonas sp. 35-63-35]OYZ18188.1 MAG: secretion system protein [Polaromonas sp. 16-63-31]OYZ77175.1 MAG: secretion system protein [Polaromonas sp. 24-63-21]OZA51262.1 MAG: secretion system protein [Polaromonas sp. 17-63-33]